MTQKIDWTKPVQIPPSNRSPALPAYVLKEDDGNRLITWTTPAGQRHAMVSEYGNLIATLHSGAAAFPASSSSW
jgi:hypothetical protein